MSTIEIVRKEGEIQTSIRLPKELFKMLKKEAIDRDMTLQALLIETLQKELDKAVAQKDLEESRAKKDSKK